MKIKTVAVSHVMDWYSFGYTLWLKHKWQWLLISLVCVLLIAGIAITPYIHWVVYILLPLWIACLLYMARRAVQGKEPGLENLGFILSLEEQRKQLIFMGVGIAGFMLLISLLVHALEPRAILNYSLDELAQARKGLNVENAFISAFIANLLKIISFILVMVALLFAPALALFRKMPAWLAVKASLKVFWLNKGALLFFLFIQFMLTLLALLPFGLGLLILLPISFLAWYRAYTEIFVSNAPKP